MKTVSEAMLSENAEAACAEHGVVHFHQNKWIVDVALVQGRLPTAPPRDPPLDPYKVSPLRTDPME